MSTTNLLLAAHINALAQNYAKAPSGIDRSIILALALDGDRTCSAITVQHTKTVANVAAGVHARLLSFTSPESSVGIQKAGEFRRVLGDIALEFLKQVVEGDTESLRIRACLIAEFTRVGIFENMDAVEQAVGCVVMRSAPAPDVGLRICEEVRWASAAGLGLGVECEQRVVADLEELWGRAGLF
ncbi:hypothetical protein DFP72DRAFT_1082475 [Ephemerocybe angulata]|uniref:Uncharacterized protein n=1 Tax=Ephemerocybe angulata TaxID=980116 RepID=A0A8H6LTZ6_9AGAR|nr:hypothetical protein DFP72DRAFT_1082475 [Tulosesus angulatus]